ncbi:glycerophosphodiester phosphodiesterase GDPDL3-like isoform X2 [Salvia hispanica]|uniref:glycerophosphodiester phosphodiesterase GDPDL3-like isoform X2 n=1 Tax=Salvia hispanica TaxID=49212 RepID=UPI002009C966|nr:glycerophosphodiester phosphodiesterase GDPDL3-like isoform X2 [Salvia hispanica]
MWKLSPLCFLLLCSSAALVSSQRSRRLWQTLSGKQPVVIARGGYSGVLPDSSFNAYALAAQFGTPDSLVWCDVQLTKDGAGICFPDIRLDNASDIDLVYPKGKKAYLVNSVSTQGWFSIDFTLKDLQPVNIKQRIYSRAPNFDGSVNPIVSVDDIMSQIKPPGLWLSVPHDAFFTQHNHSIRNYIITASKRFIINYISSPEVGFLRSIASRFRTSPTKLVFQFLEPDQVEPTTNQTYASLLSNLKFIKTFSAGIIVPKKYIIPVDNSLYLQQAETIVTDAHAAGLQVFAYNFVNDAILPYNYSYDPVVEYLAFIDNSKFSVDGVISDFPMTASASIDCYSHMSKNDSAKVKVLAITNEGASGDYPGCTDKAYEKAVSDGADILDCPVQITSEGIPFCLGSINLRDRTTASQSINRAADNQQLGIVNGIFTYNLTWTEISNLHPAIYNPFSNYSIFRNPKSKNDGNFMQLSEFLAYANTSTVSGVIISIENAAYLAVYQGLGVTDVVLDTLSKAGLNKKIMIRSSDSAVLSKFKRSSNYELVYEIKDDVGDILNSTISEIKKFASSVVLTKESVYPTDKFFLSHDTTIVPKLQGFGLSVYVQLFQNEFVSQPWDFFSDPYLEVNSHVGYYSVNGVITDYPATVARYKKNRCLGYETLPPYMLPVPTGGLIGLMSSQAMPPAEAPNPIITDESVIEPPLPPIKAPTNNTGGSSTASSPVPPNGQPTLVGNTILSGMSLLLAALVLC